MDDDTYGDEAVMDKIKPIEDILTDDPLVLDDEEDDDAVAITSDDEEV